LALFEHMFDNSGGDDLDPRPHRTGERRPA
jgi:hypothetical protein